MIGLIPVAVALLGTAVSAYDDWRTSYLNEKLMYGMVGFGLIWAVLFHENPLIVLAIAGIVFSVGFIAYLFGQIGGGDVFLFTALSLLIPFYPKDFSVYANSLGFVPVDFSPFPFVLSVFLLAGILGPMFFYSIHYFIRILKARKKIKDFRRKMATALVFAVLVLLFIFFWSQHSPALALLFLPLVTSFLIIPFKNDIIQHFCMEKKRVSKLTDDDVIALEFMNERTKKKLNLWRKTLTKTELKKLRAMAKKAKVSQIPVCENLPKFVPFIFISLVVNLLVGDIVLFLLMNF